MEIRRPGRLYLGRWHFFGFAWIGIAVAPSPSVRALFLAWVTLALLLLGLGELSRAGEALEIAGFVNATDQEAAEGYFAVGSDAMLVVKPGSGLQYWLKLHSGQRVRLSMAPEGPAAH